jgi:pentatricopeptide repeat domain-containing protein 1
VYPIPINRPPPLPNNPPLKFSSATLPPPPSPQSTFHFDSLLQHLLHLSSPPNHKLNKTQFPSLQISNDSSSHKQLYKNTSRKPISTSVSVLEFEVEKEEGLSENESLEFLSKRGKLLLNSIKEQPLGGLNDFFESCKFELFQVDLIGVLKALDLSGDCERAILLFEWLVLNLGTGNVNLDNQAVELMARILGRESQHSIASKLFDVIPLDDYSLDVRAYTTILHSYSRCGKYERAVAIFEKMNESGLSPTLVTYNVMLDVYGKMGRSWNKILGLLDEMRSKGLGFDEFTCSTVISACGREGLLDEAKEFFVG